MRKESRLGIKNSVKSAKKQSSNKTFSFILAILLALALSSYSVLAIKQLISLQGKVDFSGVLVDNGNLTVSIIDKK